MRSEYEGADLKAMEAARNYRRWILDDIRPFVGRHVVEVGAGTGAFSRVLLDASPDSLTVIEPDDSLFERLTAIAREPSSGTIIRALHGRLNEVQGALEDRAEPDTIVYINVLEHVHDDLEELRIARSLLGPEGVLVVYVPALPALFGPFDRRVGHFRRYTRKSLVNAVEEAGFEVVSAAYRDMIGVIPWWIQARILRTDRLTRTSVRVYDRLIPIIRRIDRITGPPVGKNLLVIARRRSSTPTD